jgi:ribosome-binding protein aMBF1 (putative translation factor)
MEPWRRHLVCRRKRTGLTLPELAEALGLHESCVEGLERGDLCPAGELRERWEHAIENAEQARRRARGR